MMFLTLGMARPVVTTLQVLVGDPRPDGHFGPKTRAEVIHTKVSTNPGYIPMELSARRRGRP